MTTTTSTALTMTSADAVPRTVTLVMRITQNSVSRKATPASVLG